ncbi:MAG: hypothetical protein WBQ18_19655 [Solirubrobacteraceae bacterium]|jgi:hypothetical protein
MTTATGDLRTLAFGDASGSVWGAALIGGSAVIVLGDGSGAGVAQPVLSADWNAEDGSWRLAGDGFELVVESAGEQLTEPATDDGEAISGLQELSRVHGRATVAGAELPLDCVGTRCVIEGVDAGSLGSARAVAGWFSPDEAFMLLSLRAHESAGQEADLVAATLFDPEGWIPVADPRLSTTYSASGEPSRVNLELWIGEGENEFPRRAAGEASGPGAAVQDAGLALQVVPLSCHSRGREGAGVYVLAGF